MRAVLYQSLNILMALFGPLFSLVFLGAHVPFHLFSSYPNNFIPSSPLSFSVSLTSSLLPPFRPTHLLILILIFIFILIFVHIHLFLFLLFFFLHRSPLPLPLS